MKLLTLRHVRVGGYPIPEGSGGEDKHNEGVEVSGGEEDTRELVCWELGYRTFLTWVLYSSRSRRRCHKSWGSPIEYQVIQFHP